MLRDFDIALRNAIAAVWPSAVNVGDLFHLLHATRNWLSIHGFSAQANGIINDLGDVARAANFEQFTQALASFKDKYKFMPAFICYFANQWEQRIATAEWALFARNNGIPTGDQILEAWHHHLKGTVLNGEEQHRFTIANSHKDMRYLANLANQSGIAHFVGAEVKNYLTTAEAMGKGGDYLPMISDHVASLNGVDLAKR